MGCNAGLPYVGSMRTVAASSVTFSFVTTAPAQSLALSEYATDVCWVEEWTNSSLYLFIICPSPPAFIKHLLCARHSARHWEMQHWIDRCSPYSHVINSLLAKTLNKSLGTGFLMVQSALLSVDTGMVLTSTVLETELKTSTHHTPNFPLDA